MASHSKSGTFTLGPPRFWARSLLVAVALTLPLSAAMAQNTAATPDRGATLASAVAARQGGRFEEAQQTLQNWLNTHPDDGLAWHELATLYAIHGQLRQAVSLFEKALALLGDSADARRNLAETLRADGRCAQAMNHYQTLLAADAGDKTALRGQVLCQQLLGQNAAAVQGCAAIEARYANTEFADWAHGRSLQIQQSATQGITTPEQAEAEGMALFGEKRYAAAVFWLGRAQEQAPTADRAYRLAMASVGAGDLLGGLGSLAAALRLDPQHVPSLSAWPTVQRALRLQGQGATKIEFSRQARTPTQMIAHALAEGDLILARQLLNPALLLPEKGAVLATLNGEVLLREGKFPQAAQAFAEAMALRPKYPPAQKGLAAALILQGKLEEARPLVGFDALPGQKTSPEEMLRFVDLRRAEFMHQLQMAEDPGIKPMPALKDLMVAAAPPTPIEVAEPAPPVDAKAVNTIKTPKGKKISARPGATKAKRPAPAKTAPGAKAGKSGARAK